MCRAPITDTTLADAVGCLPIPPGPPELTSSCNGSLTFSHLYNWDLSSSFSKTLAKPRGLRVYAPRGNLNINQRRDAYRWSDSEACSIWFLRRFSGGLS